MPADQPSADSTLTRDAQARVDESKYISHVRSNVKSDLIEITEDKLENIFLKHIDNVGVRTRWITPLSLLATILLTELTTTFADKFGIKAAVWEALFLLAGVVSSIWLLVSLVTLCTRWRSSSLGAVIKIIKNTK